MYRPCNFDHKRCLDFVIQNFSLCTQFLAVPYFSRYISSWKYAERKKRGKTFLSRDTKRTSRTFWRENNLLSTLMYARTSATYIHILHLLFSEKKSPEGFEKLQATHLAILCIFFGCKNAFESREKPRKCLWVGQRRKLPFSRHFWCSGVC